MAGAKTPDSIITENLGSLTLLMCIFETVNIDDGDTYVSGLANVADKWFNATNNPTSQGDEGLNVSESSGTFTFATPQENVTGTLFILTKT